MPLVLYTDQDENIQVVEVPANLVDESKIRYGIPQGPPDLINVTADPEKRKALNNALAKAFIYNYETMNGRRHEVMEVVRHIFGEDEARNVLVAIVATYQNASYNLED